MGIFNLKANYPLHSEAVRETSVSERVMIVNIAGSQLQDRHKLASF